MQFIDTNSDDRALLVQKRAPIVSDWLQSGLRIAHHVVREVFQSRTEAVQVCKRSNTIRT